MFGIDSIVMTVMNTVYNIRDGAEIGKPADISSSIVPMVLVCTDDVPVEVRKQFAKAIEVTNAHIIRATLLNCNFSRGNSDAKSIYRTIPFLNHYDNVQLINDSNTLQSVSSGIFSKEVKGGNKQAISIFMESVSRNFKKLGNGFSISNESDAMLKEHLSSAPKFIEIELPVGQLSTGRSVNKNIQVGVSVSIKVVSKEEMISMIVKQNMGVKLDAKLTNFMSKMKTLFNINVSRAKEEINMKSTDIKGLNNMINRVKGINKPFVNLLTSKFVNSELTQNHSIDLTSNNTVTAMLNKLPVAGLAVYDSGLDTITGTMIKGLPVTKKSSAEFDSEISKYERQLAEVVRFNKTNI